MANVWWVNKNVKKHTHPISDINWLESTLESMQADIDAKECDLTNYYNKTEIDQKVNTINNNITTQENRITVIWDSIQAFVKFATVQMNNTGRVTLQDNFITEQTFVEYTIVWWTLHWFLSVEVSTWSLVIDSTADENITLALKMVKAVELL